MSEETETTSQGCKFGATFFRNHQHSGSKPATNISERPCHRRQFKTLVKSGTIDRFTNHETIPDLETSYARFTQSFPLSPDEISIIDRIRDQEYPHLKNGRTCMDYSGFGLFSNRYARTGDFYPVPISGDLFIHAMYGASPSEPTLESWMKRRIMGFLKLDESEYGMVFTTTKESAFKLVSESYPFRPKSSLLTVYDHESQAVTGMKVSAAKRGVKITSARFASPKMTVCGDHMRKLIGTNRKSEPGLFVLPLQSLVTGARYSYNWITLARNQGWRILLDASGFGAKDFRTMAMPMFLPDFIVCSFHKVYGDDPTGFGCLLIKKSTIHELRQAASIPHGSNLDPDRCFKDSTVAPIGVARLLPRGDPTSASDLSVSSLGHGGEIKLDGYEGSSSKITCDGLDHAENLGFSKINNRLRCLVNWLVNAMEKLHHPSEEKIGIPLLKIFGPKVSFVRGGSLAFNIYDWKGEVVDPGLVQRLGDRNNISLQCYILDNMCYPSGVAMRETVEVVCASLGFLSNFEDVYRLWAFVARFLDADFVEKEKWRYLTLNQETIQV